MKVAIAAAERELPTAPAGLLFRKSGTEPLIRVMAEGEDEPITWSVAVWISTLSPSRIGRARPAPE